MRSGRLNSCLLAALVLTLTLSGSALGQLNPPIHPQPTGVPMDLTTGSQHGALGLTLFVGPTSGDPVEIITGYDTGAIYTAVGDAIEATEEAIVLHRNGTYRIHLEGVLFMDKDDPTADADAAALFAILVNDDAWFQCATPSNTGSPPIAANFRPLPDLDVVASCKVEFTVRVRGAGADGPPVLLPRGSAVQAALIPNDRALGDSTLMLVRFEVSRVR